MNQKSTGWVAPLVKTLLSAPRVDATSGEIVCPICERGNQVFAGSGMLCPDKSGTHLVCTFPSTETIVKIDLPKDIKVGGLTQYTRYKCLDGGHRWAFITAFISDGTRSWCASFGTGLEATEIVETVPKAQGLAESVQALLEKMKAAGHEPTLILGPGAAKGLTESESKSLKSQGVHFLQHEPEKIKATDEEISDTHPLVSMPPALRYVWNNWGFEESPTTTGDSIIPALPAAKAETDHLCLAVASGNFNTYNAMYDWIHGLCNALTKKTYKALKGLVFWDGLLLVITNIRGDKARKEVAVDLTTKIISGGSFKPNVYMLTTSDYATLVRNKANEAEK